MAVRNLVFLTQPELLNFRQFIFETSWQDGPTHNFDQTDIFLLDVPQFFVWVENAQWVLVVRVVVPQNEVKNIVVTVTVHDRRHGVVAGVTIESLDVQTFVAVMVPNVNDVGP